MKRLFGTALLVLLVGITLAGCNDTTTNVPGTTTSDGSQPFEPTGTITGKIVDRCTGTPIRGAVISVAHNGTVYNAESDTSGSFSFDKMPATMYQTTGGHQVVTGEYSLTASLVKYNQARSDSSQRYRDYYYSRVNITFTSLAGGDSIPVNGLVGSTEIQVAQLNTTVSGTVVDQNLQPVAGASVVLMVDTLMVQKTVSATDGTFTFRHVDNGAGIFIQAISADGSLSGQLGSLPYPYPLQCNVLSYRLDPQVPEEQIMLRPRDDVPPVVIGLTPANNTDVPTSGLQIVYTFSEPIQQTPYTAPGPGSPNITQDIVLLYNGMKAMKTDVPLTLQWNSTFTQLTITPQGLVGSALYTLDARKALANLADPAGNLLVDNPAIIGDLKEALNFSTNGASPAPAAPTVVRRMIPGLFAPLNYSGGKLGLTWNLDPNARSYNIYRQVGSGPFELLDSNIQSVQYSTSVPALYTGALPNPFGPLTVSYEVTGVSKDLVEGAASAPLTVEDDVAPQWAAIQIDSTSNAAKANNVYYMTLSFSEPMATASIESNPATSYVFTNPIKPLTVTKADYLGSSAQYWNALLTVSPLSAPLLPNGVNALTLTLNPKALTDLKGNGVDTTGAGNVLIFPTIMYESFEAAWSNGAPAKWTKHQDTGTSNWDQATVPFVGSNPPAAAVDGVSAAHFSSSTAPNGDQTRIESPSIDFRKAAGAFVKFYLYNVDGTDVVDVQASTDGGTTWTILHTYGTTGTQWTAHSIDLSSYAGNSSLKIGFRANSDHGTSDIWIDDVQIIAPGVQLGRPGTALRR